MSSHHIVREKQEPALLILGLDNFSEEMLGQLLEWSPTVITTPLTAEQINAFGIKVDMIIANEVDEGLQSDVKLIPPGDDEPLGTALAYLVNAGYPAVNIVTGDLHLSELSKFADRINIVAFSGGKKIFAINSGFSKWKPAGERIEVLSPSLNAKTTGLTPAANNSYTTTNDGFVTFTFTEPYLFIAEEI
jgi:thiamine pyrophosphokinase